MKKEYLKSCIICDKTFDTGSKYQYKQTCSKECIGKLRAQQNIKNAALKTPFEKECITCNKKFNPGKHKEKLNCSFECLKVYQEKHNYDRIERAKEGMLEKYGVDHPFKMANFSEHIKKTKKEKYGDENYNNREKAKETCIEKYGVENTMQIEASQKKSKKTKFELYGDENFNNREQAVKTNLEKFGVEHHLQSDEYMDKQRKTNLEKYGKEYTFLIDKCIDGAKKTNQEKYGTDYYYKSSAFLDKTHKEKLGRIEKILKDNNFIFDINNYSQIREKDEDGKLHYIFYKVKCLNCKTEFESTLKNISPICRACFPIAFNSMFNIEFEDFLKSLNVIFVKNNRIIIKPFELDFYIPSLSLAIELNGNYWHSEISGEKNKKYHLHKTELCENKEIKLIHIFEDEWIYKKEIVKSRIRNLLAKTEHKIYARKCIVKEISEEEKKNFLNNNHIQGNSINSEKLGLFYNNILVSIMTFSKRRIALGVKSTNKNEYELARFCSLLNTNVIGGFEKLLKHFIKGKSSLSIITYADCRWSGINPEKTVYNKNSFTFLYKSKPSYFYMNKKDYLHRHHRFTFNKQSLLKEFNGDPSKTEWQLAQENGYDRIWDCGTMKFEMVL